MIKIYLILLLDILYLEYILRASHTVHEMCICMCIKEQIAEVP